MNAQQKQAWLNVIIGALCLFGFIALPSTSFIIALVGVVAFALFVFTGLGALVFRETPADERDRTIEMRAHLYAFGASFSVFALGCFGTVLFALKHRQEQIPVHILQHIANYGILTLFLAHGITTLVLYARHSGGEDA